MKRPKNILTIDVEDWYHICDTDDQIPFSQWSNCESRIKRNTEKILHALLNKHIRGTFFILGYIAEHFPEVVKAIDKEGHELATHGYSHVQVYKQTPEEFTHELQKSKGIIESISGKPLYGYRAPEWSIGKKTNNHHKKIAHWALEILVQHGIHYDSSIAPVRIIGTPHAPTFPYIIKAHAGEIREFPPLVMPTFMGNIPIGGGWGLRMMSYHDIKNTIEQLNKSCLPALIYLHPWEIDEDLPRMRLPLIKRFVCYGRVRHTWEKFLRLIDEFEFTSVEAVLMNYDHNPLPSYSAYTL